jgi:hypothetical protein
LRAELESLRAKVPGSPSRPLVWATSKGGLKDEQKRVRLYLGCCMPCHTACRTALHGIAFCGLFAARTHVALGIVFARIYSVDIVLCHCPNTSSRIVPKRYPTLYPPPEQGTSNHTALLVLPGSTRLPTALQALLALKSDDPGALEAMVPKVSAMQKRGGGTGSLRAGLVRQVQNGLVVTGLGPRPH